MKQHFLLGSNPVLAREVRTALRNARSFALISLYVAVLGAVVISQFPASQELSLQESGGTRGPELFRWFIGGQALLIAIMLPALSAGTISQERERQTLEPLILSPLTPLQIVWGKAIGVLALTALLVLSTLPLTSLCFLLGGVSPTEVVAAYGGLVGLALFTASIGLYCSSRWKSVQSTLMCYVLSGVFLPVAIIFSAMGMIFAAIFLIGGLLFYIGRCWHRWEAAAWPRKLGGVWRATLPLVLVLVFAALMFLLWDYRDFWYLGVGAMAVVYWFFVAQLGLQQAAREIARSPEPIQPLRERVHDFKVEWQEAVAPTTVYLPSPALQTVHAAQPFGVPQPKPTFQSTAAAGGMAAGIAAANPASDYMLTPRTSIRQSPPSYGIQPFLSDKLNPIFAKDLRTGLLGKFDYLLRFAYIITIGTELLLILLAFATPTSTSSDEQGWFRAWAMFHFVLLLVAGTWLGSRSIAPEHEQQTLPQLLTTPLSAATIVQGKIMAVMTYTFYVFVMGLPMAILLPAVKIVPWSYSLWFLALELVFGAFVAAWGIYCSLSLVTVRRALGFALGGLFCLMMVHVLFVLVHEAIEALFGIQAASSSVIDTLSLVLSPLELLSFVLTPTQSVADLGNDAATLQALSQYPVALMSLLIYLGGTLVLLYLTERAFRRYAQTV
jgi:ABC-type transport system involved in multi-copper enzyme maturation permease subunit